MNNTIFKYGKCEICGHNEVWQFNYSGRDEQKCDICFHAITGNRGEDKATKMDLVRMARYILKKLEEQE
jgi:hypothetical protein